MAEPTPSQVQPWYLRNINQALALDSATGNVYLRTGFTGNIVIDGNVNIPGKVTVVTTEDDPLITHTHIFTPNDQEVSNTNPFAVQVISGNITVDAVTGNIAGVTANVTVVDGGGSLTVDGNVGITGNVNIGTMPNVNANITNSNIEVTQGTDHWIVSGNITVDDGGESITVDGNVGITGTVNASITGGEVTTNFNPTNLDAFGRLRVSEPYTLFDTNARYYDHGQFSNVNVGTANVVYVANQSSFQLNVGSANGDSVIRETKKVFPYQPGKSQLTLNTFCMATPKTNLRQRVGLFGANDGVFFENDGTYNYFVIRSGSTGVEERVRQDSWNGDRLNGAGGANNPSSITLYPDRTQIMFADVEWLGVGTVRVGFVVNGVYIICHRFNHANQTGNTKVYMTTATLPIRYEITNTGATSGDSMMTQICSTVISEGGYNNFGTTQTAGTGTTTVRLSTAGTLYPIVSIRLNSNRLDSIVFPRQIDVLSPSVNYYRWTLLQNATLTGATWATTSPTGTVDIDKAATAVSGGIEIQSGYASSRELTQLSATDFFQFQLGRTLANVSDTVTLALSATANNADVLAELGWQELT
jgi:hypothetical protein